MTVGALSPNRLISRGPAGRTIAGGETYVNFRQPPGAGLHEALRALHTLNTIAFIALGAVALVTWRRRRDKASVWAVAAFGSLGVLELLSLIPQHTRDNAHQAITRIEIVILVVFPYLLFRFTNAFR